MEKIEMIVKCIVVVAMCMGTTGAVNYDPATTEDCIQFFNEILGGYSYTNDYGDAIVEAPGTFNCMAMTYVMNEFLQSRGYDSHMMNVVAMNHAVVFVKLESGWCVVDGVAAPLQMLGLVSTNAQDLIDNENTHEIFGFGTQLESSKYIRQNECIVELS